MTYFFQISAKSAADVIYNYVGQILDKGETHSTCANLQAGNIFIVVCKWSLNEGECTRSFVDIFDLGRLELVLFRPLTQIADTSTRQSK